MEGISTIVAEAAREMDEMMADVMPRSWVGHGRLKVWEADLSERQRAKALKAVERFKEQKPELTGEQAAEAVIPHVRQKF